MLQRFVELSHLNPSRTEQVCPRPQVVGHLKDAFFVTLDDVQLWAMDGLDGALDQLERLANNARAAVLMLQDTQVGRAATSGLDDVLGRLEDATAYYLPLPPTLRKYWGILGNCGQDLWNVVRPLMETGSKRHHVTEEWL